MCDTFDAEQVMAYTSALQANAVLFLASMDELLGEKNDSSRLSQQA